MERTKEIEFGQRMDDQKKKYEQDRKKYEEKILELERKKNEKGGKDSCENCSSMQRKSEELQQENEELQKEMKTKDEEHKNIKITYETIQKIIKPPAKREFGTQTMIASNVVPSPQQQSPQLNQGYVIEFQFLYT